MKCIWNNWEKKTNIFFIFVIIRWTDMDFTRHTCRRIRFQWVILKMLGDRWSHSLYCKNGWFSSVSINVRNCGNNMSFHCLLKIFFMTLSLVLFASSNCKCYFNSIGEEFGRIVLYSPMQIIYAAACYRENIGRNCPYIIHMGFEFISTGTVILQCSDEIVWNRLIKYHEASVRTMFSIQL